MAKEVYNMMNEALEKAEADLLSALDYLRGDAYPRATATEALILRQLIDRTAELKTDIGALFMARIADARTAQNEVQHGKKAD